MKRTHTPPRLSDRHVVPTSRLNHFEKQIRGAFIDGYMSALDYGGTSENIAREQAQKAWTEENVTERST